VYLCFFVFFLRPEQARAAQGSPEQPRAAQSSQGQFRCGCIAEILIFYCVALCFLELDLSFHVIKPNLPRKPFPPAPDPLKIIQNHLWQASQPASSGHCLFVCFFVFFVVVGVGVCVNGCCHHNTTHHNTTQHNTTQHNTTQHNTTQHNRLLWAGQDSPEGPKGAQGGPRQPRTAQQPRVNHANLF